MKKFFSLIIFILALSSCNIGNTKKTQPVVNFSLSTQLQTLNNPLSMPPLQNYAQISFESYLVVVGGNTGGIHDFDGGIGNNPIIYWLNLNTNQVINSFDTSTLSNNDIKNQLSTIAPEFVESNGYLYYIGGCEVESVDESTSFIRTMPSVVRINIPALTNAVFNNNLSNTKFIK